MECVWSALVLLAFTGSDPDWPIDYVKVRSDTFCQVSYEVVPKGVLLQYEGMAVILPIPHDGKPHMVTYDFQKEYAEISIVNYLQVERYPTK